MITLDKSFITSLILQTISSYPVYNTLLQENNKITINYIKLGK